MLSDKPVSDHTETREATVLPVSHTPGPWFVGAQNDALFIIDAPPRPSNDYPAPNANVAAIAKIYHSGMFGAETANARLIAAAPDLLEACRDLVDRFESRRRSTIECSYVEAKAAIAKAEGR